MRTGRFNLAQSLVGTLSGVGAALSTSVPPMTFEGGGKQYVAILTGLGRSVEADADIDLPKLLKADVVIGGERSVDEAREEEAAGRRERCAVIGIRLVDPLLDRQRGRDGGRRCAALR
jgi:hypothetical protein